MAERDLPISVEREELPCAPLAAPPLAPGRWGVAAKLRLAFGLLLLIMAVSGVISLHHIRQIDRALRQVVET